MRTWRGARIGAPETRPAGARGGARAGEEEAAGLLALDLDLVAGGLARAAAVGADDDLVVGVGVGGEAVRGAGEVERGEGAVEAVVGDRIGAGVG
ncbi:MAG: hypothetical protein ACK559_38375, partial [bacterium]